MIIGMRAHDLGKDSLENIITKIKQRDISHIQLAFAKAIADIDFSVGNFSPGLAEFVSESLKKENITVSVLGCYINFTNPNNEMRNAELAKFKEHIKYAHFMGAHMVGSETGTYAIDYSHGSFTRTEGCYQLFLKSLQELADYAKAWSVMIAVEGVASHTLYNPETIKRFLEDINSPNVHVIYDPVNLIDATNYQSQTKQFEKVFSLYPEKLAAIHLKDFKIEDGVMKNAPIGEGLFDFESFFYHLKKHKPYITALIEDSNGERFIKDREFLYSIYSKVRPAL